jgi:biopolymer transport protein ExbD
VRFRRPSTTAVDFGANIINLVDVLLLLLIFFMLSTTFSKRSDLSVQLPEASGAPAAADAKRLEIVITANSHYSINDRSLANGDLETIKAALREVAGGDTARPLTITADGNAPHQAVVRAMDAAGQLGFSRLSLTTQLPKSAP